MWFGLVVGFGVVLSGLVVWGSCLLVFVLGFAFLVWVFFVVVVVFGVGVVVFPLVFGRCCLLLLLLSLWCRFGCCLCGGAVSFVVGCFSLCCCLSVFAVGLLLSVAVGRVCCL